jgi:hypothetical protein
MSTRLPPALGTHNFQPPAAESHYFPLPPGIDHHYSPQVPSAGTGIMGSAGNTLHGQPPHGMPFTQSRAPLPVPLYPPGSGPVAARVVAPPPQPSYRPRLGKNLLFLHIYDMTLSRLLYLQQ